MPACMAGDRERENEDAKGGRKNMREVGEASWMGPTSYVSLAESRGGILRAHQSCTVPFDRTYTMQPAEVSVGAPVSSVFQIICGHEVMCRGGKSYMSTTR